MDSNIFSTIQSCFVCFIMDTLGLNVACYKFSRKCFNQKVLNLFDLFIRKIMADNGEQEEFSVFPDGGDVLAEDGLGVDPSTTGADGDGAAETAATADESGVEDPVILAPL